VVESKVHGTSTRARYRTAHVVGASDDQRHNVEF